MVDMPSCPKCNKNSFVRHTWSGKYLCEREYCRWVFGRIPGVGFVVADDQFVWWD